MKKAVYFCNCGGNVSERIDSGELEKTLTSRHSGLSFRTAEFLCSEEGRKFLRKDLEETGVERVVVAACSPREHEGTFMKVLSDAGLNPYLMQMVNVREQVAWVTPDLQAAGEKAARLVEGAIRRVSLHEKLHKREIDVSPSALVIGAGPAGLKAALGLAEAGREVTLVEKTQVIGGMPVRYEELFPDMECGPCVIEPLLEDLLHGEFFGKIDLLTLSEVEGIVGSYGNFTVTIRQKPRRVDLKTCIGCSECIGPCPVTAPNEFDYGMGERKAMSLPFAGGLPNVPCLDDSLCLRFKGGECSKCLQACPVEGAIVFDDEEKLIEKNVGAVIVAVGGDILDMSGISNPGGKRAADLYSGLEFERLLASNGPTAGEIRTAAGEKPGSVAIVHCVGSLDSDYREYCSGICCQYAFKYSHLLGAKVPGIKRYHFYKEIAPSGKEIALYRKAKDDPDTVFIRYGRTQDLDVEGKDRGLDIRYRDGDGKEQVIAADMAVFCTASMPSEDGERFEELLQIDRDRFGFFEEFHSRTDPVRSTVRGIYIAGSCQAPMDIQGAMSQGMAAAGCVLSGLVPGRKLEISPVNAVVDEERCSRCRVCVSVCPYKAISFDDTRMSAQVTDLLCLGCGTCVAACPSGAIRGNHFTTEEIMAEIEGILS